MNTRLKIQVKGPLNDAQQQELQHLGCDTKPYLTFPSQLDSTSRLVFAATANDEQQVAMKALEYVIEVGAMPTYGVC